jgi:outer membrane protein OmpA-like peptidoglycan-associated protein
MPTDGRATTPSSGDQPPHDQTGDEKPIAQLRTILLGPDRETWGRLRERLEDPKRRAEDVASVLAEAVKLRSDAKLRRALQPLVEETIKLWLQANPRILADAVSPILGRSIRKAITAELESMLESLSQTMEQSFSVRSLQWRWEAIRTHKPYAEIVLLRSQLYRVEQVFLIHRKTGISLQHVAAPDAEAKDPEMVSGMLTALQDFVQDSFTGAEGENLETVRMSGEFSVVLAYGADAILAGFVKGVVPRKLNTVFQETLDAIEQQKTEQLRSFSGETSVFDSCQPLLEACLLGQAPKQAPKGGSFSARLLLFGVPALVVMALVGWGIYSILAARKWTDFEHRLNQEPGIVLTKAEKQAGVYQISGLRDPMAKDPAEILKNSGLDAGKAEFHFQDFHSLDPQFAGPRQFADLKEQLERHAFRFKTGSSEIPPEQRFLLEDVAAQMLALIRAGTALGKTIRVEVRGNHDPIGAEDLNSSLARERASAVQGALVTLGVPEARIKAVSEDRDRETCSAVKEEERLMCRSASFRVIE